MRTRDPKTTGAARLQRQVPIRTLALLFLTGIVFWGGFNWSLAMTNAETFCISCHEMRDNVYREYTATSHSNNASGVRATCPDCHVPRDWPHMVARKIRATNELYHWIVGSIDSPEKFSRKRMALATQVWDNMRATDSRECRNCHEFSHMALERQSQLARNTHKAGARIDRTCIDCHAGLAHSLPDGFDREAAVDELHREYEKLGIACYQCHEQLRDPKESW